MQIRFPRPRSATTRPAAGRFVGIAVAAARGRGLVASKLACIDIQAYGMMQAPECDDMLNFGGFSDPAFQVIASFVTDDAGPFVAEVESIEL